MLGASSVLERRSTPRYDKSKVNNDKLFTKSLLLQLRIRNDLISQEVQRGKKLRRRCYLMIEQEERKIFYVNWDVTLLRRNKRFIEKDCSQRVNNVNVRIVLGRCSSISECLVTRQRKLWWSKTPFIRKQIKYLWNTWRLVPLRSNIILKSTYSNWNAILYSWAVGRVLVAGTSRLQQNDVKKRDRWIAPSKQLNLSINNSFLKSISLEKLYFTGSLHSAMGDLFPSRHK